MASKSKARAPAAGGRSLWSGAISFGLVTVPVRLQTAVRDRTIRFNMLTPDGSCRLRQKLYCPDTGKEYSFKDAARGFEVAPDQYVIVDQKEIDRLQPEAGRTIDIVEFVSLDEIDPMYFDRTYWLAPQPTGEKAYALLAAAMQSSGRVAIARFVMREREHLATLRAKDGAIVLHTMFYDDELVAPPATRSRRASTSPNEARMAEELVRALASTYESRDYRDEFRRKLERALEAKSRGAKVVSTTSEKPATAPVRDLMEALKRSLEQTPAGGRRTRRPPAPAARPRPKRRRAT